MTEPLDEAGVAVLAEAHEVDTVEGLSQEALLAKIPEYDALVVRSATQVTRAVLEAGRRLRVVGRAGVGVNNIDVEAATERGIVVVNVPDGNTIAATEQTFALLLALARRTPDAVASLRAGRWERQAFVGTELRGKTLGIIGLGRIGREVGRRAQAFGMNICGYDPFLPAEAAEALGIRFLPMAEVLQAADVLTVHTPLTPQTQGMIGERELRLLPSDALVLNCARGGIIDEDALYRVLVSGHLGGAALDVYAHEPATDNPLVKLPNVIATPHLGASTREAQSVSALEVARYVRAVLAGDPVQTAVNLPALSQQDWEETEPMVRLGELLGSLAVQGLGARFGEIEIRSVELPGRGGEWVTAAVLRGMLDHAVDDVVNLVNARALAHANGLRVTYGQSREAPERSLHLRVRSDGEQHTLAGHVQPDGSLRLTELDGMPLDISPSRFMLLTRHEDRPGLIGHVGSILGQGGVNIAAMLVGRRAARGPAVMVLCVDEAVPQDILSELRALPNVERVQPVVLPEALVRSGY